MKVLVTGASGLMGRALMREFERTPSCDVLGLAFSRAKGSLRKVDIRDEGEVRKVMQEFQPDAIVHAAVQRRPDVVEKDEEAAKKVNCSATETIAKISAEMGTFLIYISTDYVFDGTKPPYKPTDATNPLNKYGQQKLEGEKISQAHAPNCAILRVPVLYGQIETVEESAVTVLLNTLVNREKTDMIDDCCTRCPTSVDDIAVVCRQMCERWKTDPKTMSGVFHWCGSEFMTKYTMITKIADAFNLPHDHLKPDPVQPTGGTLRPKDCSLDRSKLEALGIGQTTPIWEELQKVMAPFVTSQ
ncbi:methionine adenosyltransferase 2 subunit beta [Strongylocentrotus purpuratus]|uniref:Methionine adenosyltransferase 2 subunit beta n=1 Tax=Strongylocentrotus purpuratus TaxID=7668 RepID=A0A7M7NGH7_STRPU|nr:methionine adenosyltransferase 2 subunit beta [Strongylocentrotus purpuratus]